MAEGNKKLGCRLRDASCLSVVASTVKYFEQSLLFLLVTSASDLPMRAIKLFCCLRSNVEASCHKQYSLMHDASSSVSHDQQGSPLNAITLLQHRNC